MCQNKTAFDVYIAVPYTHSDPTVCQFRYELATAYWAQMCKKDIWCFSPITSSHPGLEYDLPKTFDFWEEGDLRTLGFCDEIHVITADGWHHSIGVLAEIEHAKLNGIPITYVDPKDIVRL